MPTHTHILGLMMTLTEQEARQELTATVTKMEELEEQETRDKIKRPAVKAAAEDSKTSEELETQWNKEEAARAAKVHQTHTDG
jgi:hypothetical protein